MKKNIAAGAAAPAAARRLSAKYRRLLCGGSLCKVFVIGVGCGMLCAGQFS